jgi:hypothetical protein
MAEDDFLSGNPNINLSDFTEGFKGIGSVAREINNLFGQTRERINEIKVAVADSLPSIVRLGGDLGDVSATISDIALASRRNVLANTEDVETLYAATKVLGGTAETLANSFLDVGIGIEQVGKQLEDSVNYIRSIGGNTKEVMKDVTSNMDQMNRYQFEGGVQGLTKMAAQASMLRFSMNETFDLAEKVLDPEGAINVASAFQRLGVSAGALVDPFQLMNQSINDPQGLQDSLVNVAKQFTYFDEKTKTFKINPRGVLTLRELQDQTGVSAKEMSKLGIAAMELDERLSDVNAAGLKIASEEDKQYLANIATMKDGKYIVTLEDGTKKELADLTQPEFDKLIEQQKTGPKTMEEISREQMTTGNRIASDVGSIKAAIVGGATTQKDVLNTTEAIRYLSVTFSEAISKEFSNPQKVRNEMTTSIDDLKTLFKDIGNKDVKTSDALSKYLINIGTQLNNFSKDAQSAMIKALEQTRGQLGDKNAIDRSAKSFIDMMTGKLTTNNSTSTTSTTSRNRPISSLIEGTNTSSKVKTMASSNNIYGGDNKSKVNFDGGIKIDVNFNGAASDLSSSQKEQITKMFIDKMNTTDMKQYIIEVTKPNNVTKAPAGKVYGS